MCARNAGKGKEQRGFLPLPVPTRAFPGGAGTAAGAAGDARPLPAQRGPAAAQEQLLEALRGAAPPRAVAVGYMAPSPL